MAQYFFESQEDFNYDNSGYYGYIVFNGGKPALSGLLNALGQGPREHGLGWYRYGKSFRPANDGNMYDWYVRLHSGGDDKPAAQAVDDFLRRHLEPPRVDPAPSRSAQRPSEPLARDLRQLQSDIAREKDAHREAYDAQQRLATLLGSLQGIDARISEDLEQLRLDLQEIAETWRGDTWGELNLGSIVHALDSVNERLTRDLSRLQRDYSDISSAHADTLRAQDELAQVLERIKDHDRHISDDLARLQQDVQRLAERENQDSAGQGQTELLGRFDELERRLGERIDELERAVQAGTAARAELEIAKQEVEDLQLELDEKSELASQLQVQILEKESLPNRDSLLEQGKAADKAIKSRNAKIKGLQNQIKENREAIRKLETERDNWKQEFTEISQAYGELNSGKTHGEILPKTSEEIKVGNPGDKMDLEQVMKILLPGTRLVNNSWDFLKFEIQQRDLMLQRISGIVWNAQVPNGKSVQGAKGWMELHAGKQWRMYFCRKISQHERRTVIMIGKKAEQNKDMLWLKEHPKTSLLLTSEAN